MSRKPVDARIIEAILADPKSTLEKWKDIHVGNSYINSYLDMSYCKSSKLQNKYIPQGPTILILLILAENRILFEHVLKEYTINPLQPAKVAESSTPLRSSIDANDIFYLNALLDKIDDLEKINFEELYIYAAKHHKYRHMIILLHHSDDEHLKNFIEKRISDIMNPDITKIDKKELKLIVTTSNEKHIDKSFIVTEFSKIKADTNSMVDTEATTPTEVEEIINSTSIDYKPILNLDELKYLTPNNITPKKCSKPNCNNDATNKNDSDGMWYCSKHYRNLTEN